MYSLMFKRKSDEYMKKVPNNIKAYWDDYHNYERNIQGKSKLLRRGKNMHKSVSDCGNDKDSKTDKTEKDSTTAPLKEGEQPVPIEVKPVKKKTPIQMRKDKHKQIVDDMKGLKKLDFS